LAVTTDRDAMIIIDPYELRPLQQLDVAPWRLVLLFYLIFFRVVNILVGVSHNARIITQQQVYNAQQTNKHQLHNQHTM
jgi:hypothetical protein